MAVVCNLVQKRKECQFDYEVSLSVKQWWFRVWSLVYIFKRDGNLISLLGICVACVQPLPLLKKNLGERQLYTDYTPFLFHYLWDTWKRAHDSRKIFLWILKTQRCIFQLRMYHSGLLFITQSDASKSLLRVSRIRISGKILNSMFILNCLFSVNPLIKYVSRKLGISLPSFTNYSLIEKSSLCHVFITLEQLFTSLILFFDFQVWQPWWRLINYRVDLFIIIIIQQLP